MQVKQILFFALREDLIPILTIVEGSGALSFFPAGQHPTSHIRSYSRGRDIPELGKATADSSLANPTFLVAEQMTNIRVRPIDGTSKASCYSVDQVLNSDSVTFTPAGLWGNDVVLYGRVATVSATDKAQELMKRFNSAFKKEFERVKSFWVGPHAIRLLDSGKRFTVSVYAPSELDLVR